MSTCTCGHDQGKHASAHMDDDHLGPCMADDANGPHGLCRCMKFTNPTAEDRLFQGKKIVWAGRGWYQERYNVYRRISKLNHDDPTPVLYIEDADTTQFESLG